MLRLATRVPLRMLDSENPQFQWRCVYTPVHTWPMLDNENPQSQKMCVNSHMHICGYLSMYVHTHIFKHDGKAWGLHIWVAVIFQTVGNQACKNGANGFKLLSAGSTIRRNRSENTGVTCAPNFPAVWHIWGPGPPIAAERLNRLIDKRIPV